MLAGPAAWAQALTGQPYPRAGSESAGCRRRLSAMISDSYYTSDPVLSYQCHANVTKNQRLAGCGSNLAQSRVNDFICILLRVDRLPVPCRYLYSLGTPGRRRNCCVARFGDGLIHSIVHADAGHCPGDSKALSGLVRLEDMPATTFTGPRHGGAMMQQQGRQTPFRSVWKGGLSVGFGGSCPAVHRNQPRSASDPFCHPSQSGLAGTRHQPRHQRCPGSGRSSARLGRLDACA